MSRADSRIREWVDSVERAAPAKTLPISHRRQFRDSAHSTLQDSSADLARGCEVSDFMDTIPAEFEALLAFSEGRKF